MKNVYPSDVQFILSEDFRDEVGKKFSLLGVFAGDDVVLEDEALGKALPSLCLTVIGRGAEGNFSMSVAIQSPTRKDLFSDQLPKKSPVDVPKGQNFVARIKLVPFQVLEWGPYEVIFSLDDKEYRYKFIIKNT
jgi:hypothetical protein